MRGKIIIVQGGQWGSEGKGQVASELCWREGAKHAVRTGSINAGHTVYKDGKPYVMQIIPTAWVLPGVQLYLGAGCYIEPDVLSAEVAMIADATGEDIRGRLLVDHRCVWFGDLEARRAKEANRHHAMGATGKGCSEAIVSKIYDRNTERPTTRLFKNRPTPYGAMDYVFGDTVRKLDEVLNRGEHVLLEGTQGALLDFNTGPYPFVTSRMTNAAAWLAEAGLPPVNVSTALVVRSHPIRVAGNSGPLPGEIDWPTLARRLNTKQANRNLPPVVSPLAIETFEAALVKALHEFFPEVISDSTIAPEDKIRFHRWTANQRTYHRVALSEANRVALRSLDEATLQELRFFEKTTVTKKLRRVADLDIESVREAIRMNAPEFLVYTFLNYDFPHLLGATKSDVLCDPQVAERLDWLCAETGVPVKYVTTGPLPEHQILNNTIHGH
jgi:adenylosuccinate synthase